MPQSQQTTLFPEYTTGSDSPRPVNVASVPQRSPFRYPGGKTWFVPTFRSWLQALPSRPRLLVEPFAGGGSISLTALFDNLVDTVVMVEKDEDIAAVWQSIVDGNAGWLAEQILAFDLTRESVVAAIQETPCSVRERAFQTILKNRTLHGGILAEGAGFLKTGEGGKGIRSRWYPATLARRFRDLDTMRHRIDFRCTDGLAVMQEFAQAADVIFFIDPPYTAGGKKAGRRLYRHNELDHERLFSLCEGIAGDFLLTYDNAAEVRMLARRHGLQMRLIPMNNTHHATMEELVIGKNLTWMDRFRAVHEPEADYDIEPKSDRQ